MCSSRPVASGIFEVSTPCSWAECGHRLYTLAAADTYGISHADWALRLLRPSGLGNGNGKAWGVGLDTDEAELALAVKLGLIHESLLEEPQANENGAQPTQKSQRVKLHEA